MPAAQYRYNKVLLYFNTLPILPRLQPAAVTRPDPLAIGAKADLGQKYLLDTREKHVRIVMGEPHDFDAEPDSRLFLG